MKKYFIIFFLTFIVALPDCYAQYNVGTTGLLNMPTADMQRDKTVLIGGSFLDKHTSPARWHYDTFNYYFNITLFPWLEVAYDLTLFKALPYPDGHWVPRTYGKFVNQDRNFAVRIRIWKEGDWKWWMPQIVIGGNDAIHNSVSGNKIKPIKGYGNGFQNRYYLVLTKHFDWEGIGQLGAHLSYVYNERSDYHINAPAVGADLKFNVLDTNERLSWQKVLNGLDVMMEFYPANNQGVSDLKRKYGKEPSRGQHLGIWDINIGGSYSFLGDKINLYSEFYGCRYFSGGVMFKLHLK